MPIGRQYAVTNTIASVTTSKTLLQITAGATTPFWLDYVSVDGQSDVADAMDITILRKSGTAVVTQVIPVALNDGSGTITAASNGASTGTNASAEGTDGNILYRRSVSVQAGGGLAEWFPPGEMVCKAAATIAIKSNITITSQTITVTAHYTEIG